MEDLISIGQLAARAGVAASALRFYEGAGLLHPAGRTDGNRRRYHRDALRRVAFIRSAQRVGLSLDEIRTALSTLPDARTPTAADWTRLSSTWRRRLDERIELLERLRDNDWNISRTADVVGLARETLSRKLRVLGIDVDRERDAS